MTAFFVLYAITISIELLLSLISAVFLYLILAPGGRTDDQQRDPLPSRRVPARTVEAALGDAFASISQGRDDLLTISNARALLVRYASERERQLDVADV
jgi:hypothetical protein